MGRLDGSVALITGAGSGIGRESALLFATEGARVVCADIDETSCRATADLIEAAGGEAVAVRADVSSDADVSAMIRTAEETFGKLHVLFNNAGIMHSADGNAQETTEEIWDLTMGINAKGVFLGCKHGIPAIERSGGNRGLSGMYPRPTRRRKVQCWPRPGSWPWCTPGRESGSTPSARARSARSC